MMLDDTSTSPSDGIESKQRKIREEQSNSLFDVALNWKKKFLLHDYVF